MKRKRPIVVREFLKDYGDEERPGGCEDCNATHQLREHPLVDGGVVADIYHDDGCPILLSLCR